MKSVEYNMLCRMVSELKAEIISLKSVVETKVETVGREIKESFEGFGILDPDVDTWTEQQVCERYHVSRRTMYNYRSAGIIPFIKTGKGKSSVTRYRKADIMEFFASRNA